MRVGSHSIAGTRAARGVCRVLLTKRHDDRWLQERFTEGQLGAGSSTCCGPRRLHIGSARSDYRPCPSACAAVRTGKGSSERELLGSAAVCLLASAYVAQFGHMEAYYDVPGELGYIAEGQRYGFESLSFIITETQPGGGPPLHVHETEEAHVLLEGEVEYVIGERRFRATGSYLARVPPGVAHTFANRGKCPFNLLAVFPAQRLSYKEIGPNPLVQRAAAR